MKEVILCRNASSYEAVTAVVTKIRELRLKRKEYINKNYNQSKGSMKEVDDSVKNNLEDRVVAALKK